MEVDVFEMLCVPYVFWDGRGVRVQTQTDFNDRFKIKKVLVQFPNYSSSKFYSVRSVNTLRYFLWVRFKFYHLCRVPQCIHSTFHKVHSKQNYYMRSKDKFMFKRLCTLRKFSFHLSHTPSKISENQKVKLHYRLTLRFTNFLNNEPATIQQNETSWNNKF